MSKLEWCIMVIATWFVAEVIFYLTLGSPIEWRDLPTVITVCFIAWFTFPARREL